MSHVFGIEFSPRSMADIVDELANALIPPGTGPRAIVTANLDHIVQLTRNAAFRAAYANAWLTTADGMPVYAYAKLRGSPAPARVTGADLFAELMARLPGHPCRLFFAASSTEAVRRLRAKLVADGVPAESLAFAVPPFGFERDAAYSAALAARIRAHGTTHLFLGVGAPKSEIWTERHRPDLGDCYVLCIGAGIEMLVGLKQRAPAWVQRIGGEWLWRFAQEPRRLFRRYFVSSWRFLGAVRDDVAGKSLLR